MLRVGTHTSCSGGWMWSIQRSAPHSERGNHRNEREPQAYAFAYEAISGLLRHYRNVAF
jgi:hypothetical protein